MENLSILLPLNNRFLIFGKRAGNVFDALDKINEENLYSTTYIRGEAHPVIDAVLRQLAHYPTTLDRLFILRK